MAQITNLLPILSGQSLDADTHRTNFNNIASVYNSHDRNGVSVHGLTGSETMYTTDSVDIEVNKMFPIGTTIQVWDNDIALVKALVDSDYMKCMNGQTVSDVDSPFDGVTLPDNSEAYLMGSLSDIIATKVGDPKDKLTHTHTFTHTHTSSHTHTIPSHTHSITANYVNIIEYSSTVVLVDQASESSTIFKATSYTTLTALTATSGSSTASYCKSRNTNTGTTAAESGTVTGLDDISKALVTDGGTTYSYNRQLRSIRCRYYVRIK